MLLRRVIEHVKTQNWTAVALDFVIVVVGVFIGIQVSNWNETRKAIADERNYIMRLHDDVLEAESKSARLRERRFEQRDAIVDGLGALFEVNEPRALSEDECLFIAYSHDYSLTAPAIPSFDELLSSGRLEIIRDEDLIRALTGFQQSLDVLAYWRSWGTREQHTLMDKYPELIEIESYYDDDRSEVWSRGKCDTEGMRNNPRFLNNLSENADTYDAFVRDALDPWNTQLSELHSRLDELLTINHETA